MNSQYHKYKLYKLKSTGNSLWSWKFYLVKDSKPRGTGEDTLQELIKKEFHRDFMIDRDWYDLILEFNNLEEIYDLLPEEFI